MRTENLIMGGCTLDEQENELLRDSFLKLQDVMQEIITKLIELRKDTPMSIEKQMAVVFRDFEFIIEDEACEAEDLIREEVPEGKLTDFAILVETLRASNEAYVASLRKHLNK